MRLLFADDPYAETESVLQSLGFPADWPGRSFGEMLELLAAGDPLRRPLLNWITGNTYGHYREHRATITRFAEDEGAAAGFSPQSKPVVLF